MLRSADVLERAAGARPVGMRAPSFEISRDTLAIAEEMGLSYDASLMADDEPHALLLGGPELRLIELPSSWVRDDGAYLGYLRRELEAAHRDGGFFQLVMHPHVIGYRSRIWILDEVIRHARSLGGVWFATHAEVTLSRRA
jgi:peptidoglycan/xylan/chitin deacetylase (PgdA/CDA1 family)